MATKMITINSKDIKLMKPITGADYDQKTVLTNSCWEYVELWLRRQTKDKLRAQKAMFFWKQAKNFYHASEMLPIESKPLTDYYCCMNAAKALLAIKGAPGVNLDNIDHGIGSDRNNWKTDNLADAKVQFCAKGVLAELSKYLGEDAQRNTYSVYDILYNIPCVHRAFSITYARPELFIPIKNIGFCLYTDKAKGWLQFEVDKRYSNGTALKNIPSTYESLPNNTKEKYLMRSKKRFDWDIHDRNKTTKLKNLSEYHKKVRKDIHYIVGDTRLWYLKKKMPGSDPKLNRNSITLIFAVMHWLSELVRYNPLKFESLMKTKQNWLINEFVQIALHQYIDEISCEITGTDIMTPGYKG